MQFIPLHSVFQIQVLEGQIVYLLAEGAGESISDEYSLKCYGKWYEEIPAVGVFCRSSTGLCYW